MVNCQQVRLCRLRAHLYSRIVGPEIPRRRVTHHVAPVGRPLEQRLVPERLRQRVEAERGEELLTDGVHIGRRQALDQERKEKKNNVPVYERARKSCK